MFFLEHIWLIPLLPAFGAAVMFFFGRKLQKSTVNAVCVGVIVLAFLFACLVPRAWWIAVLFQIPLRSSGDFGGWLCAAAHE